MRRFVRRRASGLSPEGGFTLIEVVVSLSLLALLATSALYFFIAGTRSVTHLQRAHGAVALANDAMEEAYSWVATASTTGTSGLVVGRTQADVTAAWALATSAGVSGVTDSFPAWDTAVLPVPLDGTVDDTIALTSSATESRALYQVTTLIGTCYRTATIIDGPCTKTGGDASGTPLTGYVRLMRVIVTVDWPDTAGSCGGTTCSYEIASLIDPNTDVEWNNTTRLLAVDDSVAVNAGDVDVPIAVLANDTLPQLGSNPVTMVSQPKNEATGAYMGTVVLDTATGKFKYTAKATASVPAAPHGHVTFTYRVTVGARTAQAVVHLYITPQALPYAVSTVVGTPVSIPVTTVSGTKPNALTITSGPSAGSVTTNLAATPANFKYTPGAAGIYAFTYTYVDSDGLVSLAGTVTVTVTAYAAPVAAPIAIPLTAVSSPLATSVPLPAQAGPGYLVRIISPPALGVVTVDGTNAASRPNLTGAVAKFTPPASGAGVYTFTYQMVTPDGSLVSLTETVTVTVTAPATGPVGQDLNVSVKKKKSVKFTLPSTEYIGVRFELGAIPPDCGKVTIESDSGKAQFEANDKKPSCEFTYRVGTASPEYWSAYSTVHITVTN